MNSVAFGLSIDRPAPASRVREVAVPGRSRRRSSLARIDYADAFLVDGKPSARLTPEDWARQTLEGAPALVRQGLAQGWRALGLRLGTGDDRRRVLGWPISESTPTHALLAADSRLGFSAEILFQRFGDGLLFCTFVENHNPLAGGLWVPLGPWHRRVVRDLLSA